ncbi:glutathione S-transferase family protein [Novosphingobium kaempferiae]|uniref:glutathione S-transferase family protein n=1 Tax=Novosphingobium kaempferiae TaxID=2896849 RepID=UPI001E32F4E9|nr:glutathione S-transferase family protein [Novosphingobium kaempferiae]
MIVVHHLARSQSERIAWLCEELSLPYTIARYERLERNGRAPEAFKALHPLGIAPLVESDGRMLAESGAIVDHILARHGDGRLQVAPESRDFDAFLFWKHFANATFLPAIITNLITAMAGATDERVLEIVRMRLSPIYPFIEDRLSQAPFFAGERFTAADIMMVFPLTTQRHFHPRDHSGFPAISRYLSQIGQRPAYQAAMARAEPGFAPLLD